MCLPEKSSSKETLIPNYRKALVLSMALPQLIQRAIMIAQNTGKKSSQRISLSFIWMVFWVLKQTVNKYSLLMNMPLSPMMFALKWKRSVLLMTSKIIMILSTKSFHTHFSKTSQMPVSSRFLTGIALTLMKILSDYLQLLWNTRAYQQKLLPSLLLQNFSI